MLYEHEKRVEKRLSFLVGLTLFSALILFALALLAISAITRSSETWVKTDAILVTALTHLYQLSYGIVSELPDFISKIVTWPIVALISIFLIFVSKNDRSIFSSLANRTKKLKLSEFEVELSEEGARQLNVSSQHAFQEFRAQANAEFSRQVRLNRVRQCLETALRDTVISTNGESKPLLVAAEARCTIHVRDILFTDNLLQLIDYYPDGGGAMRRFSIRYGAIGRAWRLERHFEMGLANAISQLQLVELWGMTNEEGEKITRHSPSYLCVVIKNAYTQPIAIVYLDSKKEEAFGKDDDAIELCKKIEENAKKSGLTKALDAVTTELGKYAADINVEIQ